jgi:hypothetical protein
MEELRTMFDNNCDFCLYTAKNDMGLRIHFAKKHMKAQERCENMGGHDFRWSPSGICNRKDCGMQLRWLDEVELHRFN